MAQVLKSSHIHDHYTESGEHIISKDISYSHIGSWLKKGWMDMAHAPAASLFYGLVMMFSVLAVYTAFKDQPITIFKIATFFVMISPFLATGLYAISCQLSKGQSPDLFRSMFAWRRNKTEIALFALVLGVIVAMWATITPLIAAIATANTLLIINPEAGLMGFLTSDAGINFLISFAVLASLVTAFVFTISVITIPLLLRDTHVGVVSAMILSFQVVMENKKVMAAWALTLGGLVMIGIVTLGVAMVVVMPLLGYASWHAFNDLIEVDDGLSNKNLPL
ncbi:DUF2189 domain-containing protein [Thiomicrorhabdus aquaedulcis]|uniref:DUF2189 domain-containing protein n=1 Tax=Thiomicrorhabdus aquaedulcis TaxID=2211106 RepID=UPI000FDCBB72|nr:DUF2189 domain-containing protein [Thiomicrorhabdus aquaedulcis]